MFRSLDAIHPECYNLFYTLYLPLAQVSLARGFIV